MTIGTGFDARERGFENEFAYEHDVAAVALLRRFAGKEAEKAAYLAEHGGLHGAIEATIGELARDPERKAQAANALFHGMDGELAAQRQAIDDALEARRAARAPEEEVARARWAAAHPQRGPVEKTSLKPDEIEKGDGVDTRGCA